MKLSERINAFAELGDKLLNWKGSSYEEMLSNAYQQNAWFTTENTDFAIKSIINLLDKDKLIQWVNNYLISENRSTKKVGIVMAGNIPLVGFHDFLAILISGHAIQIKPSSQDEYLPKIITKMLIESNKEFSNHIEFVDILKDFDAVIATGSDNSARYFEYYFSKYPHIIRKNRTSIAIINGNETNDAYEKLGDDIFRYFGLGCRNISKIYIPENFNLEHLLPQFNKWHGVIDHHKYANNYDYNRSIFLLNQTIHLDTGFLLLTESQDLVSPLSVLYYEKYTNQEELNSKIKEIDHKLQCVVSQENTFAQKISFGETQKPTLWDYADNVDTMDFLANL